MHDTGYLSKRPARRGVLGAVVAVHAAGLTVLLLAAPVVEQAIDRALPTRNIPLATDPPPRPIDKPIVKNPRAQPQPRNRVEPPSGTDQSTLIDDSGPMTASGAAGEGMGPGDFTITTVEPPRDPVIVAPRFTSRNAQPPYPPALQRMEIEGSVTVRVLVGVDGRPLRIEVVRTDNDAFFAATRDWAMRKWRFTPATRDGVPIEEWRTMTVRFSMNG